MQNEQQQGFTLLEIVIFVLIVGFLLAGALKGQELITSAKVKRIAGQLDEIRTAYFGFQDRYKALPGDYADAQVNLNCGTATCLHGNGDSRIRDNETVSDGNQVREDLLVWSHLSSSGFMKGSYRMTDGDPAPNDANAPKNPYAIHLQLVFDGMYGINAAGTERHNLKTGGQIPVSVLMELDRKVDDGKPYQGTVQFSAYVGNAATAPAEGGATACTVSLTGDSEWNYKSDNGNCGAAVLL